MIRYVMLAVTLVLLLLAVPGGAAIPTDEVCVDEIGKCVDTENKLVEKYKACLYWPTPSYCPNGGPPP